MHPVVYKYVHIYTLHRPCCHVQLKKNVINASCLCNEPHRDNLPIQQLILHLIFKSVCAL